MILSDRDKELVKRARTTLDTGFTKEEIIRIMEIGIEEETEARKKGKKPVSY